MFNCISGSSPVLRLVVLLAIFSTTSIQLKSASAQGRRGAMVAPNLENDQAFKNDLDALSQMHANLIRYQFNFDDHEKAKSQIRRLIDEGYFASRDMKVILDLHNFKNNTPGTFTADDKAQFKSMWKAFALEFKNESDIFGFDLLNEPKGSRGKWRKLAINTTKAIRKADRTRRVIIGYGVNPVKETIKLKPLPKELNPVWYSIHMYEPFNFTHQSLPNALPGPFTYPGTVPGSVNTTWNKKRLRKYLGKVRKWQTDNELKVMVGEFSAVRWANNANEYLEDCINIFEKHDWPWCYHAWRESTVWRLEWSTNKNVDRAATSPTERYQLLSGFYSRNTHPYNQFGRPALWHWSFSFPGETPMIGDFNGDSVMDAITFAQSASDVYVALSNGVSITDSSKWHSVFAFPGETPAVGDFNGDGLDDIATFTQGSTADVWIRLSNGFNAFIGGGKWHNSFSFAGEIPAVGDFNGDGLDDIATFVQDAADVWVALSSGTKFGSSSIWHSHFAPTGEIPAVGDFNGDGLDDIVTFTQSSSSDVWVRLSNGSSFGRGGRWHNYFSIPGETPRVADLNGDGLDDILTFNHQHQLVWVAYSTGTSFTSSQLWGLDSSGLGEVPFAGDVNGDGFADIINFSFPNVHVSIAD